jgi:hypothetical protein
MVMAEYLKRKFAVFSLLAAMIFMLGACSDDDKDIQRALVVNKLKSSSDLATVEYVIKKLIIADKEKSVFGIRIARNASFMAETKAVILAGIDLRDIREKDVVIEGEKINLQLPPVRIIDFSYPPDSVKIIERYTDDNFFNRISVGEKDDFFRQSETALRESLEDLGIKKTAEDKTKILLESLLTNLGFSEIYIHFQK